MINCRKRKQYGVIIKSITFVVITTFLCSNSAWAFTELPQTTSSLQANSAFDEDPRNNDTLGEMTSEYTSRVNRGRGNSVISVGENSQSISALDYDLDRFKILLQTEDIKDRTSAKVFSSYFDLDKDTDINKLKRLLVDPNTWLDANSENIEILVGINRALNGLIKKGGVLGKSPENDFPEIYKLVNAALMRFCAVFYDLIQKRLLLGKSSYENIYLQVIRYLLSQEEHGAIETNEASKCISEVQTIAQENINAVLKELSKKYPGSVTGSILQDYHIPNFSKGISQEGDSAEEEGVIYTPAHQRAGTIRFKKFTYGIKEKILLTSQRDKWETPYNFVPEETDPNTNPIRGTLYYFGMPLLEDFKRLDDYLDLNESGKYFYIKYPIETKKTNMGRPSRIAFANPWEGACPGRCKFCRRMYDMPTEAEKEKWRVFKDPEDYVAYITEEWRAGHINYSESQLDPARNIWAQIDEIKISSSLLFNGEKYLQWVEQFKRSIEALGFHGKVIPSWPTLADEDTLRRLRQLQIRKDENDGKTAFEIQLDLFSDSYRQKLMGKIKADSLESVFRTLRYIFDENIFDVVRISYVSGIEPYEETEKIIRRIGAIFKDEIEQGRISIFKSLMVPHSTAQDDLLTPEYEDRVEFAYQVTNLVRSLVKKNNKRYPPRTYNLIPEHTDLIENEVVFKKEPGRWQKEKGKEKYYEIYYKGDKRGWIWYEIDGDKLEVKVISIPTDKDGWEKVYELTLRKIKDLVAEYKVKEVAFSNISNDTYLKYVGQLFEINMIKIEDILKGPTSRPYSKNKKVPALFDWMVPGDKINFTVVQYHTSEEGLANGRTDRVSNVFSSGRDFTVSVDGEGKLIIDPCELRKLGETYEIVYDTENKKFKLIQNGREVRKIDFQIGDGYLRSNISFRCTTRPDNTTGETTPFGRAETSEFKPAVFQSPQCKKAIDFYTGIGAKEGDVVVNIGSRAQVYLPLAALGLGIHYVGYDLDTDNNSFINASIASFTGGIETKGSARQLERFSSNSQDSKIIEDSSTDHALLLTGILSEPYHERHKPGAKEVINEVLRVIKNNGRITLGAYTDFELDLEEGALKALLPNTVSLQLLNEVAYPATTFSSYPKCKVFKISFSERDHEGLVIVNLLKDKHDIPRAKTDRFGIGYVETTFTLFDDLGMINLDVENPEVLVIGGSIEEVQFLLKRYPKAHITVVNLDMGMLTEIKIFVGGKDEYKNRLKLYCADASQLQCFSDMSFDLVFARGVDVTAFYDEEYGLDILRRIGKEIERLTKPSGIIFWPTKSGAYSQWESPNVFITAEGFRVLDDLRNSPFMKRDVLKGTPATLLRYMYANRIFNDNPKKSREMAKQRGGNDSIRTIQKELRVLKAVGLAEGNPRSGYYLHKWLRNVEPEDIIRENPELNIAETSEEQIRTVAERVKEMARLYSMDSVIKDVSDEERSYYSTVIDWAEYILRNYKTRFRGNKLIFIGGSCKRAWEAARFLCADYGIEQHNIIYLDLPREVMRKSSFETITKYLEQEGVFDSGNEVTVFDNWSDTGGTLNAVTAILKNRNPGAKVFAYLMNDNENAIDNYANDIIAQREQISRAAVFIGKSNWMRTDLRKQILIGYKEERDRIEPVYLPLSDLSIFLAEINEDTNIHLIDPNNLTPKSQQTLSLVQGLLELKGFSKHFTHSQEAVRRAYQELMSLCENNPSSIADRQDAVFNDLLRERRTNTSKAILKSIPRETLLNSKGESFAEICAKWQEQIEADDLLSRILDYPDIDKWTFINEEEARIAEEYAGMSIDKLNKLFLEMTAEKDKRIQDISKSLYEFINNVLSSNDFNDFQHHFKRYMGDIKLALEMLQVALSNEHPESIEHSRRSLNHLLTVKCFMRELAYRWRVPNELELGTRQKKITERFIDRVKKQERGKTVLVLDTDIGNMTQFETENMLSQIKDVCNLLGDIEFIAGPGEELSGLIKDKVNDLIYRRKIRKEDMQVVVVTKKAKEEFEESYHITRINDVKLGNSGGYVPILELLTFALRINIEKDNELLKHELRIIYHEITGFELTDELMTEIKKGMYAIPLPPTEKINMNFYNESIEILGSA